MCIILIQSGCMLTGNWFEMLCTLYSYDCVRRNQGSFKEDVAKKLIGAIVLTRYNNRTYRVEDIAWDQNPKTTFPTSDGTETTFIDYYR